MAFLGLLGLLYLAAGTLVPLVLLTFATGFGFSREAQLYLLVLWLVFVAIQWLSALLFRMALRGFSRRPQEDQVLRSIGLAAAALAIAIGAYAQMLHPNLRPGYGGGGPLVVEMVLRSDLRAQRSAAICGIDDTCTSVPLALWASSEDRYLVAQVHLAPTITSPAYMELPKDMFEAMKYRHCVFSPHEMALVMARRGSAKDDYVPVVGDEFVDDICRAMNREVTAVWLANSNRIVSVGGMVFADQEPRYNRYLRRHSYQAVAAQPIELPVGFRPDRALLRVRGNKILVVPVFIYDAGTE